MDICLLRLLVVVR